MIAAASAAMVGGAFADAQVWEMSLTVKTTESKAGTVKSACDACDGATSYRKQASVKINGVFWGCTCDEMVGLTGPVSENEGVFFWNATKKAAFYDQAAGEYAAITFGWDLLNRIGQKGTECEGVWNLDIGAFKLYGAGFGTVKGCDDASYISSMKGNFAGTYLPGNGCKRCEQLAGNAWALCDCTDAGDETAAYGTWTLKYNASATKKFANSEDWSWYKWPGDTLAAIQFLIKGAEPTPGDEKKEIYLAAKADWEAAKEVTKAAILVTEEKDRALQAWLGISLEPDQTYRNFNGREITVTRVGTTKAEDDAAQLVVDLGTKNETSIKSGVGLAAGLSFLDDLSSATYGIAAATVTAYDTAKLNLRDAQANLTVAQKAKELDVNIDWSAAAAAGTWRANYARLAAVGITVGNARQGYWAHNGTQVDIDSMNFNIKHTATDAAPGGNVIGAGVDVDLAKAVTDALDALKGAINAAALSAEDKAKALKIITDYDADFAAIEAAMVAQQAAALERIAATANMTTAQIKAKTADLLQALKDADQAEGLAAEDELNKQMKMNAAKANCGAACD